VKKPTDGKTGGAGSTRAPRKDSDSIFGDKRSGRDRREEMQPFTEESRRGTGDRRKTGRSSKAAWWLERDYVETHHFLQKSSSSRSSRRDDDTRED